jgi:hypothetical protein
MAIVAAQIALDTRDARPNVPARHAGRRDEVLWSEAMALI